MIRAVFESFCRALIRFWDNRFGQSDEIQFLRMELEKSNQRYLDLVKQITASEPKISAQEPPENWKQLAEEFKPWHVKQRELELASAKRAFELQQEAKLASEKTKTTEQLESELGIK